MRLLHTLIYTLIVISNLIKLSSQGFTLCSACGQNSSTESSPSQEPSLCHFKESSNHRGRGEASHDNTPHTEGSFSPFSLHASPSVHTPLDKRHLGEGSQDNTPRIGGSFSPFALHTSTSAHSPLDKQHLTVGTQGYKQCPLCNQPWPFSRGSSFKNPTRSPHHSDFELSSISDTSRTGSSQLSFKLHRLPPSPTLHQKKKLELYNVRHFATLVTPDSNEFIEEGTYAVGVAREGHHEYIVGILVQGRLFPFLAPREDLNNELGRVKIRIDDGKNAKVTVPVLRKDTLNYRYLDLFDIGDVSLANIH